MKRARWLGIVVCVAAAIAALAAVVMWLWNWLMPSLFAAVPPLGYTQALGLLVLCRILFGGFRGGHHRGWWAHRQRWESMSAEEREQLKEQLKDRWGCRK